MADEPILPNFSFLLLTKHKPNTVEIIFLHSNVVVIDYSIGVKTFFHHFEQFCIIIMIFLPAVVMALASLLPRSKVGLTSYAIIAPE